MKSQRGGIGVLLAILLGVVAAIILLSSVEHPSSTKALGTKVVNTIQKARDTVESSMKPLREARLEDEPTGSAEVEERVADTADSSEEEMFTGTGSRAANPPQETVSVIDAAEDVNRSDLRSTGPDEGIRDAAVDHILEALSYLEE